MKVFDNYEISPCTRIEEPDVPGKFYYEVCEPTEADVWTLYGHINGEGVQAIGDFDTRERAEEIYSLITGEAFPGSCKSGDRLRVMHAGSCMLDALKVAAERLAVLIDAEEATVNDSEAYNVVSSAIAKATGRIA